eukprot:scaffold4811_cov171-Cylindrotheca_fusiformis.AAC.1
MPARTTNVSTLTYPRTGKRGVPQQFPRRLYEMLESEAKSATKSPSEEVVISWSDSGRAFRIVDVGTFVTSVLPKYFRTKKFSSFQRNLNLYGFTKVRRGPDTDMYAHPAFMRGRPESLSELRKSTSSSRQRLTKASSSDDSDGSTSDSSPARSISPSPPRNAPSTYLHTVALTSIPPATHSTHYMNQTWLTFCSPPYQSRGTVEPVSLPSPLKPTGAGRLDLLALAVEREQCRV